MAQSQPPATASRLLRAVGLLVALASLLFVLLPFRVPAFRLASATAQGESGLFAAERASTACGPAIVDAWHAKTEVGWFGYAPLSTTPLSSTPPDVFGGSCRTTAQHRVRLSLIGLLVAIGLFAAAWTINRRPLTRGRVPKPASP